MKLTIVAMTAVLMMAAGPALAAGCGLLDKDCALPRSTVAPVDYASHPYTTNPEAKKSYCDLQAYRIDLSREELRTFGDPPAGQTMQQMTARTQKIDAWREPRFEAGMKRLVIDRGLDYRTLVSVAVTNNWRCS